MEEFNFTHSRSSESQSSNENTARQTALYMAETAGLLTLALASRGKVAELSTQVLERCAPLAESVFGAQKAESIAASAAEGSSLIAGGAKASTAGLDASAAAIKSGDLLHHVAVQIEEVGGIHQGFMNVRATQYRPGMLKFEAESHNIAKHEDHALEFLSWDNDVKNLDHGSDVADIWGTSTSLKVGSGKNAVFMDSPTTFYARKVEDLKNAMQKVRFHSFDPDDI